MEYCGNKLCNAKLGSLHKTGLCRSCRDTECSSCGKINTWQKVQKRKCIGCGGKLHDRFKNYTGHISFDYGHRGNDITLPADGSGF